MRMTIKTMEINTDKIKCRYSKIKSIPNKPIRIDKFIPGLKNSYLLIPIAKNIIETIAIIRFCFDISFIKYYLM